MSLHDAYDPGNIFAKILRGEAPCHRVYEDADTLAFLDLFPQSRGHTLVIPKVAARNVMDFDPEAWGPLMRTAHKVALAVERALKPEGVTLMQLNGAAAGQTVFHLHVHVIPRWADVKLKGHGQAGMADREELAALAAQIAAAI
jgi:histidine triad (HIT) family protein